MALTTNPGSSIPVTSNLCGAPLPKRDNDVANIVDLRMKCREPRTDLIHERFFVPRNRKHVVKGASSC